jgi:hypothetical protein
MAFAGDCSRSLELGRTSRCQRDSKLAGAEVIPAEPKEGLAKEKTQ